MTTPVSRSSLQRAFVPTSKPAEAKAASQAQTQTQALVADGFGRETVRRGDSGDDVVALQEALRARGFDPGPVDGEFGPQVQRAVRAFQTAQGLAADGVVGPKTWAALGPAPTPRPSQPQPPTTGGPAGPELPPTSGDPAPATDARSRTDHIGGVDVWKADGKKGFAFRSEMSIDADGSPHAYNPSNTGLDALGNAGHAGNWWGIATDRHGKPVVQGPNDPAPGYYVSTTALEDSRFPSGDPRRYVNSEEIPFIAVPPQLQDRGVKLGDLVAVKNERTGKTCFAIVADIGPRDHLGEGSIRLAKELGIDANARSGGQGSGVEYVVLPGTSKGWPRSFEQIQADGRAAYDAWGGQPQADSTLRR